MLWVTRVAHLQPARRLSGIDVIGTKQHIWKKIHTTRYFHKSMYKLNDRTHISCAVNSMQDNNKKKNWQNEHYQLLNSLPRNGDFMAASTIPTNNCRLLGSWASPEAKAASASAWRPRYWRATPCRKYACRGREGGHVRAPVLMVYTYTLADTLISRHLHFFPHEQSSEHGTSLLCIPITHWSLGFLYLLIGLKVLHKRTCYTLAGCLLRSNYCFSIHFFFFCLLGRELQSSSAMGFLFGCVRKKKGRKREWRIRENFFI